MAFFIHKHLKGTGVRWFHQVRVLKGCQRRPGKLHLTVISCASLICCKMCSQKWKDKWKPTVGYIARDEGEDGNLGFGRWHKESLILATFKGWLWGWRSGCTPCCGISNAVPWGSFHLSLAHCHAFWQGRLLRDCLGTGLLLKVFFFFFGLFIYTCLCCEPNLYLKSWYSLSIFYFILLYMSWIVIMM